MKVRRLVSLLVLCCLAQPVLGFNLWTDIQQNTVWTLGDSVAAGTAMALKSNDTYNLKSGEFIASALAQIGNYRLFSAWAGGNFIRQPVTGDMKAMETVKVGINLAYIFKGFTNQPPDIIKNMVIGPSCSTTIWTTPHVFLPFLDVNYAFGGTKAMNINTPPAPAVSPTSRLNLIQTVASVK